ncbi:MAG: hypothetical protein ACOYBY_12235 [Dermatophilaceae bacterium]
MDEVLQARLAAGHGTLTTHELAAAGYERHAPERLVRDGVLRRVRHAAYVDAGRYEAADHHGRHELETRAVVRSLSCYAASHVSALVWWGLPVLRSDLGPVHVCGIGKGRARGSPGLQVHRSVGGADVVQHRGIPVVVPELAVLQVCRSAGPRAALVAAEAGLRAGLVCRDTLARRQATGRWGLPSAHVVALADGLSESAGESWCRLVFAGLGLVQPEQQVEIRDDLGRFVARVDFLFRELNLVVEFDGALTYAGADGREALIAEKRREDALRRLGYRVVRLTWADLHDPERVLRLLGW